MFPLSVLVTIERKQILWDGDNDNQGSRRVIEEKFERRKQKRSSREGNGRKVEEDEDRMK